MMQEHKKHYYLHSKLRMKNVSFLLCCLIITTLSIAQNGFTDLFDGKDLNGWKRVVGSANIL